MAKRYKVYLSGPIEGIPADVARLWRDQVELALPVDIFECLNPMSWASSDDTPEEYFRKDVEQLERADILLVNVQDEPVVVPAVGAYVRKDAADSLQLSTEPAQFYGPMRGTTWEVGWAYARGLPIYIVYQSNEHQMPRLGPFLYSSASYTDLDLDFALATLETDAEAGVFNEPDKH